MSIFHQSKLLLVGLLFLAGCATTSSPNAHVSSQSDLRTWDTTKYYDQKLVGKVIVYGAWDLFKDAKVAVASESSKSKWYEVGMLGRNEKSELSLLEGNYIIHVRTSSWQQKAVSVAGGKTIALRIKDGDISVSESLPENLALKKSGALNTQYEFEQKIKANFAISYDLNVAGEKKPVSVSVMGAVAEPVFKLNGVVVSYQNVNSNNYTFSLQLNKGSNDFVVEAYGLDRNLVSQKYVFHIKTDKEIQDEIAAAKEAERIKAEEIRQRQIQLEIQARAKKAEEERIAREGDGSPDDVDCKKYGLKPQTQGYAECRMRLDLSRKESERAKAINLANIKAIENARQADLQRRYEEEQRQKQVIANRESRCELLRAQEYLRPGNGSFADSALTANNAYENCMAGVPQIRTTCNRDSYGNYSCTSR